MGSQAGNPSTAIRHALLDLQLFCFIGWFLLFCKQHVSTSKTQPSWKSLLAAKEPYSYKGTEACCCGATAPLSKQDSSGTPSSGLPPPHFPSLAQALHGWPFLPLPCCFSLGLGLGTSVPTPSNWPQTVLGSGLHLVLCPPIAAKHCAVSQTYPQSHNPEQPRSPEGHSASLLCWPTGPTKVGLVFLLPSCWNSATRVISFRSSSPAQKNQYPPFCLVWQT